MTPLPIPADARPRAELLYLFGRVQYPGLAIDPQSFQSHLGRAFATFQRKSESPVAWPAFLDGLYLLDWMIVCACLEGLDSGWELLFSARTGRSDCMLVDALRARACRLYPRDEEKRESAVAEFWSQLIVGDSGLPVLERYDGQRPLAPWLIRVFQNWHLSKLRRNSGIGALPEDDLAAPLPQPGVQETRWHESFCLAARDWLTEMSDQERLLLGLRWRYRMSQRDVANLLGVHEGTISRQTDKLRDHALESIGTRLVNEGWTGDDLNAFILTEMGGLLVDDPRLSADQLGRMLAAKGKSLPGN
jgi:RNA polymerase sigma factor (sigma-70 family)